MLIKVEFIQFPRVFKRSKEWHKFSSNRINNSTCLLTNMEYRKCSEYSDFNTSNDQMSETKNSKKVSNFNICTWNGIGRKKT